MHRGAVVLARPADRPGQGVRAHPSPQPGRDRSQEDDPRVCARQSRAEPGARSCDDRADLRTDLLPRREDLVDFEGTGLSVVELSHRGAAYEKVQATAISLLRGLLAVPDTHDILLLQGGARTQFAMIPLNLLTPGAVGDYALTGVWARAAYDEAVLVGKAHIAADTREADGSYRRVPRSSELVLDPAAAYLHICSNNTVYGTQWAEYPDTGDVPLIADMTSDIMSRAVDVSRFGMIYAAAQKNLGPSGVVAVIIRKDLIERSRQDIPTIWRYSIHAKNASLYYTPTTFAVAMMRHVLEHAVAIGGISAIETTNREKARRLYAALDARPEYYRLPAAVDSRSLMNVTFFLPTTDDDKRFLAESERRGMVGLKGHRTAGGIRASIYNWVSLADVDALVELITEFGR
ncbi:MAG: 3-phosphoserine/phosphohydroxythreonine transaminase [Proteobacteria bacterium]|nr:3-phosphoserine/phosphohydroxythreonine transaminase [Pseudomonadota bacterium]